MRMTGIPVFIRRIVNHPGTAVAVRLVLGGLFVYASWNKIGDPEAFARAVQNYRILPAAAINLVAIVLPWMELVCGLLLLAGVLTGGSSLAVAVLLAVFLVALASALFRGLDISCGCFSPTGKHRLTVWYLLRDGVLLLLSLQVFLYDQGACALARWRRKRSSA